MKINYQKALENLRVSTRSNEKVKPKNLFKVKAKEESSELEAFNCMWSSSLKSGQKNEKKKFSPIGIQPDFNLKDNSVDFAADFQNLDNLNMSKNSDNQSLNLGSEYNNNEYQFDDRVSSVQRDLSLDNCTDEYNSILNSSDMSNSENNDKIENLRNQKIGGLTRDKTKGKLSSAGLQGMARVKSSVKLFTVDNDQYKSYDSENFSDLSTGDSAYPVLAFKQRAIKEFEPKITINYINNKQKDIIN